MTLPPHRGRRIPPKSGQLRPDLAPPAANPGRTGTGARGAEGTGVGDTADPFGDAASAPGGTEAGARRGPTRAQNRAAKRASGVRPKAVGRGRVGGRPQRRMNTGLIALLVGAFIIGIAVIALGNPFGGPASSPSPGTSAGPVGDGTCPTSQPAPLAAGDVRTVTVETEKGTIVMRIDGALAPIATGNFVALVECEFYDGLVFHRLMPGFVIQGGDPAANGSGGPGYEIKDDPVTTTYKRGTIAMARTPRADSQGSQFFVVLSDNANQSLSSAQYKYAILGEVTSGMDVVDAIAAMPNTGGQEGRALQPVKMTRVTVAPAGAASPSPGAPSSQPSTSPSTSTPTTAPASPSGAATAAPTQ